VSILPRAVQEVQPPSIYRGHCETFQLVTARKTHRCDYSRDLSWFRACAMHIKPGNKYVRVTVFPGHDFIDVEVPTSGACCVVCAEGYNFMDDLVHGVA
jgi:hypothetical protein